MVHLGKKNGFVEKRNHKASIHFLRVYNPETFSITTAALLNLSWMSSQNVTCWQLQETINPRTASIVLGLCTPAGQPGIVGSQGEEMGVSLRRIPPYGNE